MSSVVGKNENPFDKGKLITFLCWSAISDYEHQHTAVVEITSWVSLKKTFSVPWDAKYTTTEGQAILFPFLRVQSSSYCKWRDILYIVHNTKCSLSVIYYFLDVEMLLLWLRLRKRDNHLQKNIVKIFRVLLYANALFCLWSPSCNFLARWLWLHEIGVWGLKNE